MIDLGQTYHDFSTAKIPKNCDDKCYPSVYIDSAEELPIPEKGEVTFKVRRTSKTKTVRDGETSYSVSFELLGLVDAESEEDGKKEESSRDSVLDKLREMVDREG